MVGNQKQRTQTWSKSTLAEQNIAKGLIFHRAIVRLKERSVHSVEKVYAVLPFYDVKCLCSGGRE